MLKEILKTVKECMSYGKQHYGRAGDGFKKTDGSYVTLVDTYLEKKIFRTLKECLPEAGCIGEETDANMSPEESEALAKDLFQKEYAWVVDPIDGTSNFTFGSGEWAISIGLLKKDEHGWNAVFGIVALPMTDMIYISNNNELSLLRGGEIVTDFGNKIWENTTSPEIIAISIGGNKVPMYKLNKGVKLRALGCTVTQILGVTIGSLLGTVIGEHIWDFAGTLALGNCNGYKLFDTDTYEEVKGLTLDMFHFKNTKQNWLLKQHYYYCHPNHLETLKQSIVKL